MQFYPIIHNFMGIFSKIRCRSSAHNNNLYGMNSAEYGKLHTNLYYIIFQILAVNNFKVSLSLPLFDFKVNLPPSLPPPLPPLYLHLLALLTTCLLSTKWENVFYFWLSNEFIPIKHCDLQGHYTMYIIFEGEDHSIL